MNHVLVLLLCVLCACRPATFSDGKGDNGNDDDEPDTDYRISLSQLKIKDKERISINISVRKGKKAADDVEVEFTIACRESADASAESDYGKALNLGAATTNSKGAASHVSDKVLQPIDEDDADRECRVAAITDDGKEHEIGILTVNAALRLIYELGEELTIPTPDEVFDTAECQNSKLLVLQLQTVRGVAMIITDRKSFTKVRREDRYEKIFVVNTEAKVQGLTCQLYDNIVSMQNSAYATLDYGNVARIEAKHEKMWLKDGNYWRPTIEACDAATPQTRDGVAMKDALDNADGDYARVPLACIAADDEVLVYYDKEFKLYKITN